MSNILRTLLSSSRHREVDFLSLCLIQSGKLRLGAPEFPRTENIKESLSEVADKPIYGEVNGGVDEL